MGPVTAVAALEEQPAAIDTSVLGNQLALAQQILD
jgi:hypothetical protein